MEIAGGLLRYTKKFLMKVTDNYRNDFVTEVRTSIIRAIKIAVVSENETLKREEVDFFFQQSKTLSITQLKYERH